MDKKRWEKIDHVFQAVGHLGGAARSAEIYRLCGDDPSLVAEIEALIHASENPGGFLSEPFYSAGLELLASGSCDLPPEFPDRIGIYKIVRLIGRGGMGSVFLALDERLNRSVAIKVIPHSISRNADTEKRFATEAQAASQITHQNVAHIYEFDQVKGFFYLTMEYVPGRTLRDLIQEKLISENNAADYADQIAAGLSAAHRSGVIHRDIKPENIVIDDEGVVKILDFGIAKLIETDSNETNYESSNTLPGLLIGTSAYMSPEQVRGHSLDQRTDIWSLGIVLFEMLTSCRPFEGDTPSDIQAAILRDDISKQVDGLSCKRQLKNLVRKCLEKDRLARFQSASEFRGNLDAIRISKKQSIKVAPILTFVKHRKRSAAFLALILVTASSLIFTFFSLAPKDLGPLSEPASAFQTVSSDKKFNSIGFIFSPPSRSFHKSELLWGFIRDISEELNSSVGSTKGLSVVNLHPEAEDFDYSKIKAVYHVDAVWKSTFYPGQNGKFDIMFELIDAENGGVVWSKMISASEDDLATTRLRVLTTFKQILSPYSSSASPLFEPSHLALMNENSYKMYLREKIKVPIQGDKFTELRRVVDEESTFPQVPLQLARAFYVQGSESSRLLAMKYVKIALESDRNLSQAYELAANVSIQNHDWIGAEQQLRYAIEANPSNRSAGLLYAEKFLPAKGKLEEALTILKHLASLDPFDGRIVRAQARTNYYKRDYEGAVSDCNKSNSLNPGDAETAILKTKALVHLGKFEDAIVVANSPTLSRGQGIKRSWALALANAARGEERGSRELLFELENELKNGNPFISHYELASIYAALKDPDMAFVHLERQFYYNSPGLTENQDIEKMKEHGHSVGYEFALHDLNSFSIDVDPLFDSIRSDPRYPRIRGVFSIQSQASSTKLRHTVMPGRTPSPHKKP